MASATTIVWFRSDLRVADNPALRVAVSRGLPVIPVFVWSPEEEGAAAPGSASRYWLHQSLAALDRKLHALGSRLIIRSGPALSALTALAKETHAGAVLWNRRYEPAITERDRRVKEGLRAQGLIANTFNASLLFEPWQIATADGRPFQVFSPYWRACLAAEPPPEPLPEPGALVAPARWPKSEPLASLKLEPKIDWAGGIRAAWTPGENGAEKQLERFLSHAVDGYLDERDHPDVDGTSRLSPHLHFGEIGPRQVWYAVRDRMNAALEAKRPRGSKKVAADSPTGYLRELGWREFAYHLLFHFPQTVTEPLRPNFRRFPWARDEDALEAWQRGRTGYPLVDAGMRQLWETGWMHNRVRMIVGSFLVKDLLLPWQEGAAWFWDTLVDADQANNTLGWQWIAGCGADAAPYFRVFNPITQARKFDPRGVYVKRFVPELAKLPPEHVHEPWEAPADVLAAAGVTLGKTYPRPIVAHAEARERALAAFASIRAGGGPIEAAPT